MSQHCRPKSIALGSCDARYLEFTDKPGVLRCLKPGESPSRAHGLYFECPRCSSLEGAPKHGVTLLFGVKDVPEKAQPHGRYHPEHWPCQLGDLSLVELVAHPCGFRGSLSEGVLSYR